MQATATAKLTCDLPAALDRELGEVLVVGIGNLMRGDDAAGVEVARLVAESGACAVIIAEDVPENYLGPMQGAGADTVIFCDAVDLRARPGTIEVLDIEELSGASISTHNSSLRLVAGCLREAGVARVLVAGIQPGGMEWGAGMSDAVRSACGELARILAQAVTCGQREAR